MKLIKKYLFILLIAVGMGLSFTACDPDDSGGDYRLAGSWSLAGDSYGALPEDAYCEFYFRTDGAGTYSCYDQYGYWQTYPMSWWADGGLLTISVSWDTWTYNYSVEGGWLYLYPLNDPNYLVFMLY